MSGRGGGPALALLACIAAGCRTSGGGTGARPDDPRAAPEAAWFTDVTSESGVEFVDECGANGAFDMAEIVGSGCALVDVDGDADLDLLLVSGNHELPGGTKAAAPGNRFYLNDGRGRFTDATESSGLRSGRYCAGVAAGDYDNDGDQDLFLANNEGSQLFRNDGGGRFTDVTEAAGAGVDGEATSSAFLDYDRDGWLDIYAARYVRWSGKACSSAAGVRDYCGPKESPPVSDVLLHSNGDGTFTDVSEKAGMAAVRAAGLGLATEDFDGDGWIDVYVANDGYPNQLWLNQHDGTFRDVAYLHGAAVNAQGQPEAGMGIFAADVDADLDLDIFITHLVAESNTLFASRGAQGGFCDHTAKSGLGPSSVEFTGWGTVALDAELDGDLDIVVGNGRVAQRVPPLPSEIPPPWNAYAEPALLYVNDGSGRFELVRGRESALDKPDNARGLAAGDIDGDGDLDLVFANLQRPARILRNDAPREGHWLAVRAREPSLRRDALGAQVTLTAGGRRMLRSITSTTSYLTACEPLAHFGTGAAERYDALEVRWPDGTREVFPDGAVDTTVILERGAGRAP